MSKATNLLVVLCVISLFSCTKEASKEDVIIEEDIVAPSSSADSTEYVLNWYIAVHEGDIDYIQNYISNKYYNYLNEYKALISSSDLRIFRNTIYAIHGYRFRSVELQEHFQKFEWYSGTKENVDDELSENELEFVQLILSMEAVRNEEIRIAAARSGQDLRTDFTGQVEGLVISGDYVLLGTVLVQYQGEAENVVIPEDLGITEIADGAFLLTTIQSITIPEGVKKLGARSFRECFDLREINLPASLTTIGERAFEESRNLTSISIPVGVTSIGEQAFSGCSSLESIEIPSNVSSIGAATFYYCESLTSVTIQPGITSIGTNAFYYCSSLTSINIPTGVTTIGNTAFAGCSDLVSVTIPSSVTSIGNSVFHYCPSLTAITIPASVTSIGTGVFTWCRSLTGITVDPANTAYSSSGGVFFNKSGTTLIRYPIGKQDTEYTIPAGVTSIEVSAFSECHNLRDITLPAGVTTIGNEAFSGCTGLASITILTGLTSIGNHAFNNCIVLTSITLPAGVTSIGNSAFSGCRALTAITIPPSVSSIGSVAFFGCSGLRTATLSRRTQLGTNAFPSGVELVYSD